MNKWVWSNGGMILTGEIWTVLGEKLYTSWVVDRWLSMEQWWNDTGRGILNSTRRKTLCSLCASACLTTLNLTWNDLGSNPGFPGEKPPVNCLHYGTLYFQFAAHSFISSELNRVKRLIVVIKGLQIHSYWTANPQLLNCNSTATEL